MAMEKDVNRLDTSLRHSKTLISPNGIDLHSSCFKLVRGNREGLSTNLSRTSFLGKRSILQHGEKHPFDSYLILLYTVELFPNSKTQERDKRRKVTVLSGDAAVDKDSNLLCFPLSVFSF